MRKTPIRTLCCLLLLVLANLAFTGGASAQQQEFFPPYELYKFYMNGTNGYFYTPWYSTAANVYTYQQGLLFGMYPRPSDGATPDPSTGLVPLHQWTVFQGARSYTYLSPFYTSHGSGYYYNGIMGYVYPVNVVMDPFGQPTVKFSAWYSQSRGYWYGLGEPGDSGGFQPPPAGLNYQFQGVACRLVSPSMATGPNRCAFPTGGFGSNGPIVCNGARTVPYNLPPPPPPLPTCDPNSEQYCYNSGGWWDSSNCTCNYNLNY